MNIPEIFGIDVFSDAVMKELLPAAVFVALKKGGRFDLDPKTADIVAEAMKEWAICKGATHYTHWFQPMTGITAEKHDSFLTPVSGGVIMSFSGKELIKGEPDASSLPTGGLRATFEARGYTAWDPTSPVFVKKGSLYIPTAFCSYDGDALDKKTPLLRSMEVLDRQATRLLKIFGEDVKSVTAMLGAEQEYFLIDKEVYNRRPDLINCGRTLLGARPPKGQELNDHYFGSIKPRVRKFMTDLDEALWRLGIPAKTRHNESAPAQHEFAPVYEVVNVATDHNQLAMELLKNVAARHGLVCLLHEKPFEGLSGSGKHNNWSLQTDKGVNLFDPGETPSQNARFLLFLAAVVKGVDEYQDLLRISAASAGNDHRLGANEAPPAIVSLFLGEELSAVLDAIITDKPYCDVTPKLMRIGVTALPRLPKDTSDRNRTAPVAFTGNKFEFRMAGAPMSTATPSKFFNAIVADALAGFADRLEVSKNLKSDIAALIKETITRHKRIIYSGNSYSKEWEAESKKRGLSNLPTAVDALPKLLDKKNVEMLGRVGVYSQSELTARCEISLNNYCNIIRIEGLTLLDMTVRGILPAALRYQNDLALTLEAKRDFCPDATAEKEMLVKLSALTDKLYKGVGELDSALKKEKKDALSLDAAKYCRNKIFATMEEVRKVADQLERLTAKDCWPYPDYADILYSVR